uniref:FGE-sulfatase domain-containing protein n=1 Tax=Macrostomum lignano TaxID=282301 RepID=A0A1I8JN25_9PLAT
ATQILIGFVAMVTPLTGLVGADCGCALGPRAGQYTVGTDSPQLPSDGESPARLVRFRRPFRLDTAAVTRGQFAQFVRATGHRTDAETAGESFVPDILVDAETFSDPVVVPGRVANAPWWLPVRGSHLAPAGRPVRRVESRRWSRRTPDSVIPLSTSAGETPTPTAAGRGSGCPPTEDEWEAACRAGLSDRLFPWGNAPRPGRRHRMNIWQGEFPRLNTADDGYVGTAPVDAYGPQNSFGLYNMVGNVWEWTASRWDRNGAPDELPQRPAASDEMTKRAAPSCATRATAIATGARQGSQNTADTSSANIGFRCAIDVA